MKQRLIKSIQEADWEQGVKTAPEMSPSASIEQIADYLIRTGTLAPPSEIRPEVEIKTETMTDEQGNRFYHVQKSINCFWNEGVACMTEAEAKEIEKRYREENFR